MITGTNKGGRTKDTTWKCHIRTSPSTYFLPLSLVLSFLRTQQLDARAIFFIWNAYIKLQNSRICLCNIPVTLLVNIMRHRIVRITRGYGEVLVSSKLLGQPPTFIGIPISHSCHWVNIGLISIVIITPIPNLIHLWNRTLSVAKLCHRDCAHSVYLILLG